MSQRHGVVTDQLTNIIQVIQLGKKTGRLTVERGDGAQQEDGMLLFVRGQIIEAHCGQLHNTAALDWLRAWGRCRFTFEAEGERATGPMGLQLSPTQDTGSHPALHPIPETEHLSRGSAQQSEHIPKVKQLNDKIDRYGSDRSPEFQASSSSVIAGTPYRTKQDEVGMHLLTQAGYSRLHLRLYLLVDGHRAILELTRLMGRPPEEVQQLLHDLRHLGVIHY